MDVCNDGLKTDKVTQLLLGDTKDCQFFLLLFDLWRRSQKVKVIYQGHILVWQCKALVTMASVHEFDWNTVFGNTQQDVPVKHHASRWGQGQRHMVSKLMPYESA